MKTWYRSCSSNSTSGVILVELIKRIWKFSKKSNLFQIKQTYILFEIRSKLLLQLNERSSRCSQRVNMYLYIFYLLWFLKNISADFYETFRSGYRQNLKKKKNQDQKKKNHFAEKKFDSRNMLRMEYLFIVFMTHHLVEKCLFCF